MFGGAIDKSNGSLLPVCLTNGHLPFPLPFPLPLVKALAESEERAFRALVPCKAALCIGMQWGTH